MRSPESAAPPSPVTLRAVLLGLVIGIGLNLVMTYNDFYIKNTLLIGNHFPTAGMAVLLGLVLVANTLARRWFRTSGLSQGELLLVWSMVGVAGGIGSAGFLRYIPGWLAGPAYFTTASNDWKTTVLAHLPDWMVVSKDPEDHVVRWYFEGLPHGQGIPWGPWLRPLAVWFAFALMLWAVMFAFCSLFYRQWAARERLIFPVTYLPIEITRAPAEGKLFNEFLSNRQVWIGAVIPIVVYGLNGLKTYFPTLPAFPLVWHFNNFFPDRPWSEFSLEDAHLYFSIIGLTFMLTTEISFSIWATFVLYKLSFVFVASLGSGATGFWGDWWKQQPVYETAGAVLALAGFLGWSARRSLVRWWGRVRTGVDDPGEDLLPARLTFWLLALGLAGMFGWLLAARVQWWAALGGLTLYLSILLVLTRIVAEAGLLFVANDSVVFDVVTGLVPARFLHGSTLATLMMHKGITMHDLREILLPYVMNGVRVCEAVHAHARKVLGVLALTAIVALAAGAYGRIATCYKYGGVNGDDWGNLWSQAYYLGDLSTYQKTPPNYDWVQVGSLRILPVSAAHMVVGGAVTAALMVLRSRFVWWPLHPAGFIVCGTWAIVMIWFSLFLGWLAKACVMTFGGATLYRRLLPLFLGMVLGESIIATVWVAVSLVTGRPGLYILPN